MPDYVPTNAASSGVKLEKKTLKSLVSRSDKPGLIYLFQWLALLTLTGSLVWLALGSIWLWPAMFLHGVALTVPAYAISHETAHGSAFKTRWLNEVVFWFSSLLYLEEPLHRRYTHTNHHTFTWHVGKDSQMPFDTPMGIKDWLIEVSGFGLLRFHTLVIWQLATKQYTDIMKSVTPETEFSKMTLNARIMLAIYLIIAFLIIKGQLWLLWFLVLPRLLGAPIMLLFTLLQHVELEENSQSILHSTRSFKTSWLGRFLYMNMNNHIEHHLYPQVPFYSLPKLADAINDQTPSPDNGFIKSNWDVFKVILRRSRGLSTKAESIRQAPHMISEGGAYAKIAKRTM